MSFKLSHSSCDWYTSEDMRSVIDCYNEFHFHFIYVVVHEKITLFDVAELWISRSEIGQCKDMLSRSDDIIAAAERKLRETEKV